MDRPGSGESPVVSKTFEKKMHISSTKQTAFWGFINFVFAFILFLDLRCETSAAFFELTDGVYWYIECCLVGIASMNCIVNILKYLGTFSGRAVELTAEQKKLLGVCENDHGFKTAKPPRPAPQSAVGPIISPSTFCRLPYSSFSSSMFSLNQSQTFSPTSTQHTPQGSRSPSPHKTPSSLQHSAQMASPGYFGRGTTSLSGSYMATPNLSHSINASHQMSFSNSLNISATGSPLVATPTLSPLFRDTQTDSGSVRSRFHNTSMRSSPLRSDDCIKDMKEYSQFLREHDEKEMKSQMSSMESPGSNQSFWNFNRTISDFSPMLRKYTYQIACRSPQSTKTKRDDNDDGPAQYEADEIWQRAGVPATTVDVWIEKLRKWLGKTTMTRLAFEIDEINKMLVKLGCEDMEIGEVSISTLKQLAFTKAQHIPTLNTVIPFLEVSDNQSYVAKRIIELGSAGCLADFRWQGGSDFKGKPWGEHLPSDSTLVSHVFCSYMDSRLPPHPKYPDGKTFTNQYFMKTPDKPNLDKKDNLLLYQTKINPPHFKVVIGDDVWNLPKGRNNLFYAILLFLHHINNKEKGMLGKINLGLSGINILWVVQDDSSD